MTSSVDDHRQDGFNIGWLGLIGLAGLAGLRRKAPETMARVSDTGGATRIYPAKT